jgi:hypothetical protein
MIKQLLNEIAEEIFEDLQEYGAADKDQVAGLISVGLEERDITDQDEINYISRIVFAQTPDYILNA